MKRNLSYTILFTIIFLALIVRLHPIMANMPYMYWHDENNYIESAMRFGSGNFSPMTFSHGGLYQFILFIAYGAYYIVERLVGHAHSAMDFYLSYIKNPTPFFLIARGISVFCGAGIAWLTYLIGSRIYNKSVGLAASLFASLSLIMVQISFLALADMATVFILLTSFLILILSTEKSQDSMMYYTSCLLMGLAIACKYYVAFGLAALYIAAFIKSMDSASRWRGFFRLTIIGSFFVLLGFTIGVPYFVIRFADFYKDTVIRMGGEYIVRNPNKNSWLFYFSHHLKNGLGIPLELVVIIGILYALYKRSRKDILILSFPVTYYLVFMNSVGFAYHMLPAMSFLFILAARFLDDFSRRIAGRFSTLVFVCASILVVMPTSVDALKYIKVITSDDTRVQAKSWIEKNIPEDSLVLSEGYLSTVPVHVPPVGENMETLQRDLAATLRSGGSGFSAKAKIANAGLLYGGPRLYNLVKVDALTREDIDISRPTYIIMTSINDKLAGEELAYYFGKEYYENRQKLKDYISADFTLIRSFPPTYEFTLWFPHLVGYDYGVIRKISLDSRAKYIRGPRIDVFKIKQGINS